MSDRESYTLHYWPGIPGRGEYVRLAFEHAKVSYTDKDDIGSLKQHVMTPEVTGCPPHFAPPILEVGQANSKESSFISQTPAILAYLAPKLGLAGDADAGTQEQKEIARAQVNQLTLTALDLSNETHDVHHPIAVSLTYEEQQFEAKRRAKDFRDNRITKFFKYFDMVLRENKAGSGKYLYGKSMTTADLVLFQVVDGLLFAFPNYLNNLEAEGQYKHVFGLHESVGKSKNVSQYLSSDHRRKYSMGLYRHYPELDA